MPGTPSKSASVSAVQYPRASMTLGWMALSTSSMRRCLSARTLPPRCSIDTFRIIDVQSFLGCTKKRPPGRLPPGASPFALRGRLFEVLRDRPDGSVLQVVADAALGGVLRHARAGEVLAPQRLYGRLEAAELLRPPVAVSAFEGLVELHGGAEHPVLVLHVAPETQRGAGVFADDLDDVQLHAVGSVVFVTEPDRLDPDDGLVLRLLFVRLYAFHEAVLLLVSVAVLLMLLLRDLLRPM